MSTWGGHNSILKSPIFPPNTPQCPQGPPSFFHFPIVFPIDSCANPCPDGKISGAFHSSDSPFFQKALPLVLPDFFLIQPSTNRDQVPCRTSTSQHCYAPCPAAVHPNTAAVYPDISCASALCHASCGLQMPVTQPCRYTVIQTLKGIGIGISRGAEKRNKPSAKPSAQR